MLQSFYGLTMLLYGYTILSDKFDKMKGLRVKTHNPAVGLLHLSLQQIAA
jgi:hypothetical protein